MKKLLYPIMFSTLLLFVAGLTGCKSDSVVSDSSAPAQPGAPQTASSQASVTTVSSQASATNAAGAPAAADAAPGGPNQKPAASPTLLPIMKQAQAKPGVPVSVPESMKRPLNPEEMKKAMEQLPPEVRARIQGMQAAPQGVKPQATPKQ